MILLIPNKNFFISDRRLYKQCTSVILIKRVSDVNHTTRQKGIK